MDPSIFLILATVLLLDNGYLVESLNFSTSRRAAVHEASSDSLKWVQQSSANERGFSLLTDTVAVTSVGHAQSKLYSTDREGVSSRKISSSQAVQKSINPTIVKHQDTKTSTTTDQVYFGVHNVSSTSSVHKLTRNTKQSHTILAIIPSPSVHTPQASSPSVVTPLSLGNFSLFGVGTSLSSLLETSAETTRPSTLVEQSHTPVIAAGFFSRTVTKSLLRTPSPSTAGTKTSRSSATMRVESVVVEDKVISKSAVKYPTSSLSEFKRTPTKFIQASVQISPGFSSVPSQTSLIDLSSVYSTNSSIDANSFDTSLYRTLDTSVLPGQTWNSVTETGLITSTIPVSTTLPSIQSIEVSQTALDVEIAMKTTNAIPTVNVSSVKAFSSSSSVKASSSVTGTHDKDSTKPTISSKLSTLESLYITVIVVVSLVILILMGVCGVLVRIHRSRYTNKPEFRYSVKWEFVEEGKMRCINSSLDLSIKGLYCDLEFPLEPNQDPLFEEKIPSPEEKQEIEYLSKLCEDDFLWLSDVIKKDMGSCASLSTTSDATNRLSSYSDNGSVVEKENIEPSEKGSLSHDLKSLGCEDVEGTEPDDDSRSGTSDEEEDVSVWCESDEEKVKSFDVTEVQRISKEDIECPVLRRYFELSDKDRYSLKKEKKFTKLQRNEKPGLRALKNDASGNGLVRHAFELQTR